MVRTCHEIVGKRVMCDGWAREEKERKTEAEVDGQHDLTEKTIG